MTAPALAVIGCGAVARAVHLPALSELPEFQLVGLVDARLEDARELAETYDVAWTARDHRDVLGRADAALLAVPPHLHAPIAIELLRAGVHVLVEKPMALTVADCDGMIDAAAETGAVLAVGLHRRFFDSNRLVAQLVASGVFGRVRRFELSGEGLYPWPMRSAYRYDRGHAGGGVLADTGIHYLDLVGWWFGDCERIDYCDDAEGGVEAECQLRLEFGGGVAGDVVLSKLRDLPSRFLFEFDRATLVFENAGSEPSPRVRLDAAGQGWEPPGGVLGGSPVTRKEAFRVQLRDFASAIREGREPFVPGREGRRSVDLLERCYSARRRLEHPWEVVGAR